MRKMKVYIAILAVLGACGMPIRAGIFGGGSGAAQLAVLKQILATNRTIKTDTLVTQAKEAENLAVQLKQLATLSGNLTGSQLTQIQNGLQGILENQRKITASVSAFQDFQGKYDQLYGGWTDARNWTPQDYIERSSMLMENCRNTLFDTMRSLGVANPNAVTADANLIRQMMSSANTAQGANQIAQAAAGLSAQQAKTMVELKTLIATGLNQQSQTMSAEIAYKEMQDNVGQQMLQSFKNTGKRK
jgi:P-type conjugative transfer protein TrbJ